MALFRIHNERGSALLVTLTIMGLVFLLGVMAIKTSVDETDMSFNQVHADNAYYVAQAGARHAYAELAADYTWRTGLKDESFNGGFYSVVVVDSTSDSTLMDTVVLRCTGEVDGGRSIVELWTSPREIFPFGYAMFAEAGIFLDQTTCTDSYDSDSGTYAATRLDSLGDVGTNGTVTSSKDVTFGGGIQTATPGGISLGAFNTFTGDTTSTADSVQLDIVPDEEYAWAKANSDAGWGLGGTDFSYNSGTRDLKVGATGSVVLQSGVYFFDEVFLDQDANIELAPGAQVTVYVTGNITFSQNSVINSAGVPSQLLVYSAGDSLSFNQGNLFSGAFYGPGAHIQYDQTTQLFGSLVGGTIQLDKNACFHYDRSLANVKRKKIDEMVKVAFQEL
jgi:hypothetical protein